MPWAMPRQPLQTAFPLCPFCPAAKPKAGAVCQEEALPKLLHGTFSPEYQATLLAQLRSVLHG